MKSIFLICLTFLFLAPVAAQADIINEYVEIRCNKLLNVLEIRDGGTNGAFAEQAFQKNKKELWEKYGLISYWDLIEINAEHSQQSPKEFHTSCDLQSTMRDDKKPKSMRFDITLKGDFGSSSPGGQCGGWYSFIATIKHGKDIWIDDIPFAENCGSDRAIGNVIINPQEEYVTIGTSHHVDKTLFWFRELVTITRDMIYPNYQPAPVD